MWAPLRWVAAMMWAVVAVMWAPLLWRRWCGRRGGGGGGMDAAAVAAVA